MKVVIGGSWQEGREININGEGIKVNFLDPEGVYISVENLTSDKPSQKGKIGDSIKVLQMNPEEPGFLIGFKDSREIRIGILPKGLKISVREKGSLLPDVTSVPFKKRT